uniref:Uncharacterized protein n=1 Tax=Anguilla anguilla TaxID=7936 RepID=A0A0E9WKL0_ANGAN
MKYVVYSNYLQCILFPQPCVIGELHHMPPYNDAQYICASYIFIPRFVYASDCLVKAVCKMKYETKCTVKRRTAV